MAILEIALMALPHAITAGAVIIVARVAASDWNKRGGRW